MLFIVERKTSKKLLTIGESGSTRQALTKNDLENHVIEFPNIDEQISIIDSIMRISKSIEMLKSNYEQTITLCNDLKQSLLKKIFE